MKKKASLGSQAVPREWLTDARQKKKGCVVFQKEWDTLSLSGFYCLSLPGDFLHVPGELDFHWSGFIQIFSLSSRLAGAAFRPSTYVIRLLITNFRSNGDNVLAHKMALSMNSEVTNLHVWLEWREGRYFNTIHRWSDREMWQKDCTCSRYKKYACSACGIFTSTGTVMNSYSRLFDILTCVCKCGCTLLWIYIMITHDCLSTAVCVYASVYRFVFARTLVSSSA